MKRENPLLCSGVLLLCTNLLMASVPPTASQLGRARSDTLSATHQVPAGMRPPHRADAPPAPIQVDEQRGCIVECPPGGIEEQEPCGDDTNGGCDMAVPTFEPIECNTTICGTGWFDGSTRDTDWYELVITETMIISMTLEAEFDALFGKIRQYVPGVPGCDNVTGYLEPEGLPGECEPMTLVTNCLPPGTYYIFVAPQLADIVICPADYVLTVECEPCVILGACCVDEICVETNELPDCDMLGGMWYPGATCPEFWCPNGCAFYWVTAPYTSPLRYACGADCCALRSGDEHMYEVTIPYDGVWNFNTCLDTSWDTYIFLGTEWCTEDLGYNDDSCGLQSEIELFLEAGTYYCDIEGFSGCGNYIFDVHDAGMGACCYEEGGEILCVDNHVDECEALNGDFHLGHSCDTFECPPPCEESQIDIAILTDPYPGETTWEITVHGTSEVICSGGPYTQHNHLYNERCCIPYDGCVDFTIYDSYGDGIYAPGGYTIWLDDEVIYDCMGVGWYGSSMTIANFGGGCVPDTGACCVDEVCIGTMTEDLCDALGGMWYQGETCPEFWCPGPLPDFWVDAPCTSPVRTTCGAGDDCFRRSSEDHYYLVSIPSAGLWSFNTCLLSEWNTHILLGFTPCTQHLGDNDDACGLQSEIVVYLEPGGYLCTIEGYSTCGEYIFDVRLRGDFDNDGDVDVDDFRVFLDAYGTCEGDEAYEEDCDLDDDGCITLVDYQMWIEYYRYANGRHFVAPASGGNAAHRPGGQMNAVRP